MHPKIDRGEERFSYQQIKKRYKNRGYYISKKGIYNVLNLKGKKSLAGSENETMTTKTHPKTVRMQATIKKVASLIPKENPLTNKFIAPKLGLVFVL